MLKFFKAILLVTIVLFFLSGCKNISEVDEENILYSFTDIQGNVISMSRKPERIVTLSMSTDEVMLGLVPPERMAAVNTLLDDPISSNVVDIVKKIPARISDPTVEELIALESDLIIVPDWGDLSIVPVLRNANMKVVVCKGATTLNEIRSTIELLATAVGESERGINLLKQMDDKLNDISREVSKIPQFERKSVVLISVMPTYGGIGSSFDEACHYAGVINGRAALGIQDDHTMSKEQLVMANPDVLFVPTYNNHGAYDVNSFREQYLNDPALSTITAIRENNIQEPYEGYIYNCSQDFVFGVQEIAYRVYGEKFQQSSREHLTALK